MLRRYRRHKEWRRCSVQILDNSFGVNALGIKLLKNVQTSSVALCTDGASVTTIALFYNPPSSPFLCVTLCQSALQQNYEYSKEGAEICLQ